MIQNSHFNLLKSSYGRGIEVGASPKGNPPASLQGLSLHPGTEPALPWLIGSVLSLEYLDHPYCDCRHRWSMKKLSQCKEEETNLWNLFSFGHIHIILCINCVAAYDNCNSVLLFEEINWPYCNMLDAYARINSYAKNGQFRFCNQIRDHVSRRTEKKTRETHLAKNNL